jgi:hypothetical protein
MINFNYVGRQRCVPAIAARVGDDLAYLLGYLAGQRNDDAEEGRDTTGIDRLMAHVLAVRSYVEELAETY